jgi:hypothetical protein
MAAPSLSATTITPSVQNGSAADQSPSQVWLFLLFVAFVLVGGTVILRGGPAWGPLVLVALYSFGLWLGVRRGGSGGHVWAGSAADSPYFLGFLLTLVALYYTLTDAATSSNELSPERLLQHAGAALLPTGMGLVARQFFTSKGDVASREDQVSDSATLRSIEQTLQSLVEVTRDSLRRDEEALAGTLQKVNAALGELNKDLIVKQLQNAHQSLLDALDETWKQRKKHLEADLTATKQWNQAISRTTEHLGRIEFAARDAAKRVTDVGAQLEERITGATQPMIDASERLAEAFQLLDGTLDQRFSAVSQRIEEFRKMVVDQMEASENAVSLTAGVAKGATEAADRLDEASRALSQVAIAVARVPGTLDQTTSAIEQSAVKLERAVSATVSPVQRQAREIEALIEDLTKILTTQVNSLRDLRR